MEKKEEKADEWELLPPNTSFLGLEDIKDIFSKEIDYIDYFIEQPLIQYSDQLEHQHKTQVYDEEFVQEIKLVDPNQTTYLKDNSCIEKSKEDLADDKPCSKRRRRRRPPLVVGIGELLSIGAAVAAAMVCGFLLGSGGRRDKAMNQVLVASASGMPPPARRPAAISFGGCFNDIML